MPLGHGAGAFELLVVGPNLLFIYCERHAADTFSSRASRAHAEFHALGDHHSLVFGHPGQHGQAELSIVAREIQFPMVSGDTIPDFAPSKGSLDP